MSHLEPYDINAKLMSPPEPHVIVLVGATGDLAKRKLLPGLLHLDRAALLPECRIIGTSLDDLDDESFRALARTSCEKFAHTEVTDDVWDEFDHKLSYVSQREGSGGLRAAVAAADAELGGRPRRLHYLSVPPKAARRSSRCSGRPASSTAPGSSWRSRSAPTSLRPGR